MEPENKTIVTSGGGVTLDRRADESVETATPNSPGLSAKLAISLLAVALLAGFRLLGLKLETAELVLVGLAFVPWLSAFVENIKIGSGGLELAFLKQKVAKLENKVEIVGPLAEAADQKASAAKDAVLGGIGKQPEGNAAFERSDNLPEADRSFAPASDDDDQKKGEWGGKNIRNGRMLSARADKIPGESFYRRIIMKVESTNPKDNPLTGSVTFHLHPTFSPKDVQVPVVDGVAELSRVGYGTFIIGAEADDGKTKLEFDLFELNDGDDFFRR